MSTLRKINWLALFRPKIPGLGFISLKKAGEKLRELIDFDRLEKHFTSVKVI